MEASESRTRIVMKLPFVNAVIEATTERSSARLFRSC